MRLMAIEQNGEMFPILVAEIFSTNDELKAMCTIHLLKEQSLSGGGYFTAHILTLGQMIEVEGCEIGDIDYSVQSEVGDTIVRVYLAKEDIYIDEDGKGKFLKTMP